MQEKWIQHNKKAEFQELGELFGVDQVLIRIIRNRGICYPREYEQFLRAKENLYSPFDMKDMEKGVEIIAKSIAAKEKIRIIADYDVDGVMSNYILYKGLLHCGGLVDYRIPDRMIDGYGMKENMVKEAVAAEIKTIITCDNGISAIEPILYAKEQGLNVVVTDHHDVKFTLKDNGEREYILPPADAVIDCKQVDCTYPYKQLCGAAVAYKFVQALYQHMGYDVEDTEEFIEFVAIATICDVVDLLDENRALAKKGLEELRRTGNLGLRALMKVNDITLTEVSAYHVGFILGPCINASGRLETALQSMDLLMSKNMDQALAKAEELKKINDERKSLTTTGVEQAIKIIEDPQETYMEDDILVVYLENTHESIAGIIAGRIREKYNKPTIILTDGEGGILKGSARSIEEYNIYEGLIACQEHLLQFGGHPMAAGLSLKLENLDPLRSALNVASSLTKEDLMRKLYIDVPMPVDYIRFDLVEQLELLGPFGKANPKPTFAQKNLCVNSARIVGKNRNVVRLTLESEYGTNIDAVYFTDGDEFSREIIECFGQEEYDKMIKGWKNAVNLHVAYYPEINEYQGRKSLQVVIKSYMPAPLDFSKK